MLLSWKNYQYFFPFKSANLQGPDLKDTFKDVFKYIPK